jgi:hypothetical protein
MGRLVVLGVVVAACRGSTGVAAEPSGAGGRAEELFGALAVRFGAVRRDSALEASRAKLVRYAFSPSRIYEDTTIWTARSDVERSLVVTGALTGEEYLLAANAQAPTPQHAGDMRSIMALRRIAPSVYQWDTRTEVAAGALRGADFGTALTTFGEGVQGRSEEQIRESYRAALARASETVGRLFDLDTLHATPCADGATAVHAVLSFHPERISDEYPGFAAYLKRYMAPARYRLALVDHEGGRWGLATAGDGVISFELRLRGGALAPLDSAPRPVPDSLQLRGSVSMRGPLFTIGASDLVVELRLLREGQERGLAIRLRDEPSWHFPLAVRHFIGGTLRRPFEDQGSEIRFVAVEVPGAPTVLVTEVHTVVQESFMVRWLGRYGSTLLSAVTPDVEQEADRFLSEVFAALEGDFRQLRGVAEE